MSKHAYNDKQIEWLADRYSEGYTQSALAKFASVSQPTIGNYARRCHSVLQPIEQRYRNAPLIPLERRKDEFLKLGDNV